MQFALLGMASVFFSACREPSRREFVEGDRFPDVTLPYLDSRGAVFSTPSGVGLLFNFWASWCEPCRREMPSLERLSSFFSAGDLRVVGITVDSDLNLAREFSLQHKLTFPILSDSNQALSSGILRIPAFPATYLLKRDRTIARIVVGERDWADPEVVEEIGGVLGVSRRPLG
jgi:thiol-disulfide isomerase/thioredoxin